MTRMAGLRGWEDENRGVKRKLTQRTLLQLNFCSQSIAQYPCSKPQRLETDLVSGVSHSGAVDDNVIGFENLEVRNDVSFELQACDELLSGTYVTGSVENVNSSGINFLVDPSSSSLTAEGGPYHSYINDGVNGIEKLVVVEKSNDIPIELTGAVELEATVADSNDELNHDPNNCSVGISSSSLKNDVYETDVPLTVDDISGTVLDTFIVGRKFSAEKDVNCGASISLLRDPDNPKDPYAIKVLSADSGCSNMLGFLPRELAKHLSPLVEKFHLEFEGYVTTVPKRSLDVVAIQILCRKVILHDMDHNQVELLTHLWKNVLCAVESAKTCSPTMTKYQQNFHLLIKEVLGSNPHLFVDDEKYFIESFASLPDDSQMLFARLYMRKGPWFRMSKISYPEVLDSQQAVKQLSVAGYMHLIEDVNELQKDGMEEVLNLLTVSELREIACIFMKSCATSTRKEDLVVSLVTSYGDGVCPSLPSLVLDRTGTCVEISPRAKSLIRRIERLFFLNEEQDLSSFLLADLGIIKYPTYNCIISERIFSSRIHLLAFEEAIEVAEQLEKSLDENNSEAVFKCIKIAESCLSSSPTKDSLPMNFKSCNAFQSRYSASWVYAKVLFLGVNFLERERRYKDAVDLLKQLLACFTSDGRRGCWTLRLSIDLEHMGYPNESLIVAEEGLQDPWVRAGSRMALQRRVLRLGKPPRRWKVPSFANSIRRKIREVHIQGRPLNSITGVKSRFYGEDGDQCGVEQLALQYYAGEGGGWQGVHTESGIWLTIFGLLMWDIIFSDVPDVFHNRFQTAPLDFGTDSFYLERKTIIETHLQKIHDGMAEEIVVTSWQLHFGTACRGVNWDRHCLSELRAAVTCTGGPCLASLCRNLAQDYRSWSSGMPDLLLWRFHGEYRGEAKLVEVKGPRDTLSEQQRAWLLLLMDCGFDTEVCKVSAVPLSAKPP